MKSDLLRQPVSANVKFEIFTVKNIQLMVFWVVTLCSDVERYQYFGGTQALLLCWLEQCTSYGLPVWSNLGSRQRNLWNVGCFYAETSRKMFFLLWLQTIKQDNSCMVWHFFTIRSRSNLKGHYNLIFRNWKWRVIFLSIVTVGAMDSRVARNFMYFGNEQATSQYEQWKLWADYWNLLSRAALRKYWARLILITRLETCIITASVFYIMVLASKFLSAFCQPSFNFLFKFLSQIAKTDPLY